MTEKTPTKNNLDMKKMAGYIFPLLLKNKLRVSIAFLFIVFSKLALVSVPLVFKMILDVFEKSGTGENAQLLAAVSVPFLLLMFYGVLRLANTVFSELKEFIFSKVTLRITQELVLKAFSHVFALGMDFHLARKTGELTRDLERGVSGIRNILQFSIYSIIPTFLELLFVLGVLFINYDVMFVLIASAALVAYILFTITITAWRTKFRIIMNKKESHSATIATDALLNYETVKYFNNERFEKDRYEKSLEEYAEASLKSQSSLSFLNMGQSLIIAVTVVALMWLMAVRVAAGEFGIGDLVLVNAFMIQLYMPLNFLGSLYRMMVQSMSDMDRMFALLEIPLGNGERKDQGRPLNIRKAKIEFKNVNFSYNPERQILHDINFDISGGETLAVVGSSGGGKSTLVRLLYRFYAPDSGRILINDNDISGISSESLRENIAIVPQDTVLFNDTILFNIAYAKPGASMEEVVEVAKKAKIHDFITSIPNGYDTLVGERGLKLSGGEKQRISIARALLKDPPILVFDEATSALDSKNEREIRSQLVEIGKEKTVLIIAHRLSTVFHADKILVMDQGRIKEFGTHKELMNQNGMYSSLYKMQMESGGEETFTEAEVIE